MNMSFYTAARAASTQQEKMNIISNNIANVNTTSFKSKSAVFEDLIYHNMNAPEDHDTTIRAGSGMRISHTNTDFSESGVAFTGDEMNFAITGEGFFMLEDPVSQEISYTRDGTFYLSSYGEDFFLASSGGKLVLDELGEPIQYVAVGLEDGEEPAEGTLVEKELTSMPAVYSFPNTDGMESVGKNEYVPIEKNGEPAINIEAQVLRGHLETSNVNLANELADTIMASRAYSYVLKMMQTSDETVQTINSLR